MYLGVAIDDAADARFKPIPDEEGTEIEWWHHGRRHREELQTDPR